MKGPVETAYVADFCSIMYGFTDSASADPVGPQFLRITDIQNDSVNWATVPYCKNKDAETEKYLLKEADIVFSRTGATTGKCFRIVDPPRSIFASYLIRVRVTHSALDSRYLRYFFDSPIYWDLIRDGSTGSAQGGFNAD